MLSSVLAWLSSCTLQAPHRPLSGLSSAERARAAVVVWDKQDPAGTFLVDDPDVLAANAEVLTLRDGSFNMAGNSSARYEVHVFVDGELRASAHASTERGLELGTLPEAGVAVALAAEDLGRDAYRARRDSLLARDRVLFLREAHPLAADVLTHETSLALPPVYLAAAAGGEVAAQALRAVRDSIRRRAGAALDAAGVHPYAIVAPEELYGDGPTTVVERGTKLDEYGRPAPLTDAAGIALQLPGVRVARAHLVVQTYPEGVERVAGLDPGALVRDLGDGEAVAEALTALAARMGWPADSALAPADDVVWEEVGGPEPETREITWPLLYFAEK